MFLPCVAIAALIEVVVGIVVVTVVAVEDIAIVDTVLDVLVSESLDCTVLNVLAMGTLRIFPITLSASPRVVGVDSVMLAVPVNSLVLFTLLIFK